MGKQTPPWLNTWPRKTFTCLCPIISPSLLVGHSCFPIPDTPPSVSPKTGIVIVSSCSRDVSLPQFQHSQCDCLILCGLPFSSSPWISANIYYPGQSLFLFPIRRNCKKYHGACWYSCFIYSSALKEVKAPRKRRTELAGKRERRNAHSRCSLEPQSKTISCTNHAA